MWKLLLVSLILSLTAMSLNADATSDEIMSLDRAWAKAVVAKDYAALERITSPNLIYSHSDGVIDTREDFLNRLRKNTSDYQAIDFARMEVKVFGDVAILTARARFHVLAGGRQLNNDLAYTHVYQRSHGTWVMIAHQSALMAK
ncbi:MAG: nuclear transport factor 2 family protein [Bryobacterales bacterium]|nr:nuclear transport factor 2 family protein [Bryobacterales bacterium]